MTAPGAGPRPTTAKDGLVVVPEYLRLVAAGFTAHAEALDSLDPGAGVTSLARALPGSQASQTCPHAVAAINQAMVALVDRAANLADLATGTADSYEVAEVAFATALGPFGAEPAGAGASRAEQNGAGE